MIILPDRTIARVLPPVADREWRTPSQAQPKDAAGNENRTRFRLTARLHDGHVAWRGWFDDRDDADAFLWALAAGTLHIERELWRLPAPWWHPDLGEGLAYNFATVSFLTSPTGSNQTYNVPSDWNSSNNTVEVIGAGGGGAKSNTSGGAAGGGGGGAYSKQTNISLTPGGTATYRIGSGGAVQTSSGTAGNAGGDTWFNGATLGASSVGAKGGGGGPGTSNGGAASSGVGSVKYSGGGGGARSLSGSGGGTGGGGAAGLNGNGNTAGAGETDPGGSGDAGFGGAGGNYNSTVGGNGTEWTTHGSGGGGGAFRAGGNYGGGGGGASSGGTSGAGRAGLIVITYTPATSLMPFRRGTRFFTQRF